MSDARTESSWTATTTPDLATWLLARIAEDEQAARAARTSAEGWIGSHESGSPWRFDRPGVYAMSDNWVYADAAWIATADEPEQNHIARHDPARVLAECEAKRRIVELHDIGHDPCDAHNAWLESVPCDVVRLLALPYADHPDYRDEWRP